MNWIDAIFLVMAIVIIIVNAVAIIRMIYEAKESQYRTTIAAQKALLEYYEDKVFGHHRSGGVYGNSAESDGNSADENNEPNEKNGNSQTIENH